MTSWIYKNLGLPFLMVVAAASMSGLYAVTEIDSRAYATLTSMYRQGTDRYRSRIEKIALEGAISHWDFNELLNDYWTDGNGLVMSTDNIRSVGERRSDFLKQVKLQARGVGE
jgi:hypothetical protein